ncbi:hypothetical protein GJ496_004241 [Pomphorhynchus laevis]|nr:hypothetical protein GJ496_004241 [Pomphorhynchus laevis]
MSANIDLWWCTVPDSGVLSNLSNAGSTEGGCSSSNFSRTNIPSTNSSFCNTGWASSPYRNTRIAVETRPPLYKFIKRLDKFD